MSIKMNQKHRQSILRKRSLIAIVLRLLAITLPILFIIEMLQFSGRGQGLYYDLTSGGIIGGISSVILIIILVICMKARKREAIMGRTLLGVDRRPPILYLRSFLDDPKGARLMGWRTEEEQLALVLSKVGPFIAIGRPGEKLPELGAARVYFRSEYWQDWVITYIEQAQLVVIRAGETEGLLWELEQVGKLADLARILILIPDSYDKAKYEQFRTKAKKYLRGVTLPDFIQKSTRCGSLRGIIYFDQERFPHFLTFNRRSAYNIIQHFISYVRHPISEMLERCLRPVFQQLNTTALSPRNSGLNSRSSRVANS